MEPRDARRRANGRQTVSVRQRTKSCYCPEMTGEDRRTARTRRAIVGAVGGLLLERRYDSFGVGDIVTLADVGRSTFYEHFRSKEDVLHSSMEWLLALIADAARPGAGDA